MFVVPPSGGLPTLPVVMRGAADLHAAVPSVACSQFSPWLSTLISRLSTMTPNLPTTQRAYTLRLRAVPSTDDATNKERRKVIADALWATHEAVNAGAKVFGDWLLTLRGGLDHGLINEKVKATKVQVFHFVGKGYKERANRQFNGTVSDMEADLEFLMRVALKIETIREDLGKVGTVIAEQVEEAMLGRRTTLNTEKAEKEAEPIRKMLKFERDLQKQVQALMDQYRETRKELRLSPDNICQVVKVGLALAGQPALIPTKTEDNKSCFQLPPLKGSWAACAEGLEHPHTKDIRPITFDESVSKGRDDVVLVHLNHRLPQMCLRLLRAEVWAEKGRSKLQRVSARVVPNDVLDTPAVIAHARLVVIGGDSYRLHEEIIAAGGFIKDQKWGSRLNVGQTESAVAGATAREPSAAVKAKLLELYPSLTSSLASALEARMKQMVDGLQKKLADRAEKEAKDITSILTELKKSIEAELKDPAYIQPSLFDDPEQERFERNKDAMRARAKEIPEEIKRETEAIRARFADPQARMFPVAVTFLVPKSMA